MNNPHAVPLTGAIPRNPNEIVARIKDPETVARDFHGIERSRLMAALAFTDAEQFFDASRPDVIASQRAEWTQLRTREAVVDQMRQFMPWAWAKANVQSLSSAQRSRAQFRGLLWLLGPQVEPILAAWDADTEDGPIPFSGKGDLVEVSELIGYQWERADNGRWLLGHDREGAPEYGTAAEALGR